MTVRAEQGPGPQPLLALGRLGATAAGLLTKARSAKGSSDLLDHADVIVGVAALLVTFAKWRRELRGHEIS